MGFDKTKMAAFAGPAPDAGGPEGVPAQEGGEDPASKYQGAVEALQAHANELEQAAMDLAEVADPFEVLDEGYEPPPDVQDVLSDTYDTLDDELAESLTLLAGITGDEARDLAQQLADEGAIEDVDGVAAWLNLVGNHVVHAEEEGEAGNVDLTEDEDAEDPEDDGGGAPFGG